MESRGTRRTLFTSLSSRSLQGKIEIQYSRGKTNINNESVKNKIKFYLQQGQEDLEHQLHHLCQLHPRQENQVWLYNTQLNNKKLKNKNRPTIQLKRFSYVNKYYFKEVTLCSRVPRITQRHHNFLRFHSKLNNT